ncbi:MAG TPA: CBO0543 family protein, partial [Bacilli bacterium]
IFRKLTLRKFILEGNNMYLLYIAIWCLLCWRYGDWRNWQKYHATILYLIIGDLLYNFLTYNHVMWQYESSIIPTHTFNNLMMMFIMYPASMLVYLAKFPKKSWVKAILYFIMWLFILVSFEWVFNKYLKLLTYHHGWSFMWSLIFDIILLTMVKLHMSRPLLTYLLSIGIVIYFFTTFHVPISKIK